MFFVVHTRYFRVLILLDRPREASALTTAPTCFNILTSVVKIIEPEMNNISAGERLKRRETMRSACKIEDDIERIRDEHKC